MMALSPIPFCPGDGHQPGFWYLPTRWRDMTCRTYCEKWCWRYFVHGLQTQTVRCATRVSCRRVQLSTRYCQTGSAAPGSMDYLHGVSCLHAEMRNVCPMSPPSQPENGQSLMILGFTTTSMYTSKRGIISKLSNL